MVLGCGHPKMHVLGAWPSVWQCEVPWNLSEVGLRSAKVTGVMGVEGTVKPQV
jgi:hypothetical protein